jgi:DNA-directed RNA polymerase subunit N (RpoN/RPB10)
LFATGSTPFTLLIEGKWGSFQKVINKNCRRNSGRVLGGVNKLVCNRRLIISVPDLKVFVVLVYVFVRKISTFL